MKDTTKTSDEVIRRARLQALEDASAEAQRLAVQWRAEADETHSDRQRRLRLTWSDAAEKVADAIAGLDREGRG